MERTPDGLPLRYAAQFGFGLLVYLLIGMSLFIATATKYHGQASASFFALPAGAFAAAFVFAVFARIRMGWRGFLAGAILGAGTILVLAIVFFWFVTVYVPAGK